ncbi:MAG: tRNA (adenosine(37)-N6)-threonylcarbamoyltransferase complex ATPase subunit type 1 TsaE [Patescibacteria group bacterium]
MKYITKSFRQTQKLGEKLALRLCSRQAKEFKVRKSAIVLSLQGNLGGGKTTFLQGFAKGLGIKEKVLSPTFVLIKRFKIKNLPAQAGKHFKNFYHIDCYRINSAKDIEELGLLGIILNPENIVAIEWPERIKNILPRSIIIKFNFLEKNKREVVIYGMPNF